MSELGRPSKSLVLPVAVPHPLMQRRIPAPDLPEVALEVLHVDGVEADDGRVQAHVGFGGVGAVVVRAGGLGEFGFGAVEGCEEGLDVLFVGFLRSEREVSRSSGPQSAVI